MDEDLHVIGSVYERRQYPVIRKRVYPTGAALRLLLLTCGASPPLPDPVTRNCKLPNPITNWPCLWRACCPAGPTGAPLPHGHRGRRATPFVARLRRRWNACYGNRGKHGRPLKPWRPRSDHSGGTDREPGRSRQRLARCAESRGRLRADGDAVARGNHKVFAEIGLEFARFGLV